MLGYIRNEKATAEAIRDGWLHTGDVGRRSTAHGFYWIVDRLKELIKVTVFVIVPSASLPTDDGPGEGLPSCPWSVLDPDVLIPIKISG